MGECAIIGDNVIPRSICLLLFIACVVLGIGRAIATGPVVGVCYSTNGTTVDTTYLDGGALYYPGPSDADIEQREDGFVVTHRTLFRPIGTRVYLPVVSQ